jgi:hypothetical protein
VILNHSLMQQAAVFPHSNLVNQKEVRCLCVYSAFKQTENGEFVHVASRNDLKQAVQLVETLNDRLARRSLSKRIRD